MQHDYDSLVSCAQSMAEALWAIANMQITEQTDKGEVLELCKGIASIELEKLGQAKFRKP